MSEHNKKERRRILELSSPQSSGRSKTKVQLTPVRKIRNHLTSKLNNRSCEQNDITDIEIDSNRATCSSGFEEFTTYSIYKNVNISLSYFSEDKSIQVIEVLVSEDKTISEFIKISIEQINSQLKNNKKTFILDSTHLDNYSLREVKKNGKPNYDLPIFNHATTLQNCKEDKFFLTWDDESKSNIVYQENITTTTKTPHKKKDSKEPTIKKYRIVKQQTTNEGICVIY